MKKFKVDPEKQIEAEINQHSTIEKRSTTASKHKQRIRDKQIQIIKEHMPTVKSILCIGCRDDSEVKQFHKAGFEAVGIDVANQTNCIARMDAHHLNADKMLGDFDLVYTAHSLEHMHTPEKVLANIRKVAKKGVFIALPLPHKTGEAVVPSINHPSIFDVMTTDVDPSEFINRPELLADFWPLEPYKLKLAKHRYQGDLPKELYLLFKFV